ncbi:hypothetical protein [Sphingopyxis witflariensis]|uniref:Uncharacterized protein n=1 Tax=Sphingopyxis witflariensis TaxID=173675 RepID=A0A246JTB3_9SPHN|nr:hypothetical protein [Sphingopyxis witflariensis]OWQ96254.1 hypothetical protein CDQ91_12095 [Sphingopyxis witflariensis]
MLGLIAVALTGSTAATDSQLPLNKLVSIVEPYLDCRAETDRKIIALQQKLRAKSAESAAFDLYSDASYQELNQADLQARQSCDLQKYVALMSAAWGNSKAYGEWQRNKLAEFFIDDVVRAQWTALSFRTETYEFPKPIVNGIVESNAQN